MAKKIGIDLNDTFRDFSHQFKVVYKKYIDPTFDISDEEIDSFNYDEVFPFENREDYLRFRYEDYAYELYGRAEVTDRRLPAVFNDWISNVLKNMEDEYIPDVMFVCPFEMNATIQSTLSFLAARLSRVREYYFPTDSMTAYDKCDILITASPRLIDNVPDGKTVIKIDMPYNNECDTKYHFKSLMSVIQDKGETVQRILKGENTSFDLLPELYLELKNNGGSFIPDVSNEEVAKYFSIEKDEEGNDKDSFILELGDAKYSLYEIVNTEDNVGVGLVKNYVSTTPIMDMFGYEEIEKIIEIIRLQNASK